MAQSNPVGSTKVSDLIELIRRHPAARRGLFENLAEHCRKSLKKNHNIDLLPLVLLAEVDQEIWLKYLWEWAFTLLLQVLPADRESSLEVRLSRNMGLSPVKATALLLSAIVISEHTNLKTHAYLDALLQAAADPSSGLDWLVAQVAIVSPDLFIPVVLARLPLFSADPNDMTDTDSRHKPMMMALTHISISATARVTDAVTSLITSNDWSSSSNEFVGRLLYACAECPEFVGPISQPILTLSEKYIRDHGPIYCSAKESEDAWAVLSVCWCNLALVSPSFLSLLFNAKLNETGQINGQENKRQRGDGDQSTRVNLLALLHDRLLNVVEKNSVSEGLQLSAAPNVNVTNFLLSLQPVLTSTSAAKNSIVFRRWAAAVCVSCKDPNLLGQFVADVVRCFRECADENFEIILELLTLGHALHPNFIIHFVDATLTSPDDFSVEILRRLIAKGVSKLSVMISISVALAAVHVVKAAAGAERGEEEVEGNIRVSPASSLQLLVDALALAVNPPATDLATVAKYFPAGSTLKLSMMLWDLYMSVLAPLGSNGNADTSLPTLVSRALLLVCEWSPAATEAVADKIISTVRTRNAGAAAMSATHASSAPLQTPSTPFLDLINPNRNAKIVSLNSLPRPQTSEKDGKEEREGKHKLKIDSMMNLFASLSTFKYEDTDGGSILGRSLMAHIFSYHPPPLPNMYKRNLPRSSFLERDAQWQHYFRADEMWRILHTILSDGRPGVCLDLIESLLVTNISYWNSERGSVWKAVSSDRFTETENVLRAVELSGCVGPPLSRLGEIIHLLVPSDVVVCLIQIWECVDEWRVSGRPSGAKERYLHRLRPIFLRNISTLAPYYPRFFAADLATAK